jgi:hypothetical protein
VVPDVGEGVTEGEADEVPKLATGTEDVEKD